MTSTDDPTGPRPFAFATSNHQFYLEDPSLPVDTGAESFWTREASAARLAVGDGVLGVGTECYGPVRGEIELLDAPPADADLGRWDHVVEADLAVPSGRLQVTSCPDATVHLELAVAPGTYRVRVHSENLASVDGDAGDDFYRVAVWPGPPAERRVLRGASGG